MSDARRTLSSVNNAARLLKQFTAGDRHFGVTELAERLNLGKSTVHRLLATLEAEQLIEQDAETGLYRLGLAMLELGEAASAPTALHQAVLMPMTTLRLQTGETVQTAVLDGREVVYVERLESPNTLRVFLSVGHRNWAHATSTGKCLLAHLDERQLDRLLTGWELPAKTPRTITDQWHLRRELKDIRSQGYARNFHESETGIISVAAPVRTRTGTVVAAISVAGPSCRMEASLREITQAVVEAAAAAGKRIHHPEVARLPAPRT